MYCSHCGVELPDGARYCPACGSLMPSAEGYETPGVPAPEEIPTPSPKPAPARKDSKQSTGKRNSRLAFGIVAVLVLLAAILFGKKLLSPRGIALDEIAFPDEVLRMQVAMAADLDGDGLLSADELAALKMLRVTGARSVSGLEVFPALAELAVGGEELEEVALSEMPALETVWTEDAPNLEQVTITKCEELKTADFSGADHPDVVFDEDTQPNEVIMPQDGTVSGVDESVVERVVPADNGSNNVRVASDGRWLYHVESGEELAGTAHEGFAVVRTGLNGTNPEEICVVDIELGDVDQFAVANGRVVVRYTLANDGGGIFTARTDGSDAQVIYPYRVGRFAIADGRLYFGASSEEAEGGSGGSVASVVEQIVSCKLDGSDLTVHAERGASSASPAVTTDVCAVSYGLIYCTFANSGLVPQSSDSEVVAGIIDIGWNREPGYVDNALSWASTTYAFTAPGWTKPGGEEYVGFGGWVMPAHTLFGNADRVFEAMGSAGIVEQTYGNPKSISTRSFGAEVTLANASQRYAAIVADGTVFVLRLSDDRLVKAVDGQGGQIVLGADIVDDTLYYFLEGESAGLNHSIDLIELFEQAEGSYYEDYLTVAKGLIAQHGEHSSASSSDTSWATGLAYADLIDFDADGIEELLVVYRDSAYGSGSDGFQKEAYHIEVWGPVDGGAVLLGQLNPSFAGEAIAFTIWRGERGAYVTEGDHGGGLIPGTAYETAYWGLEGGTFKVMHRATMMDAIGAVAYTVDGSEASEDAYRSVADDLGGASSTFHTLVGLGYVSFEDMFATTDKTLQTLESN